MSRLRHSSACKVLSMQAIYDLPYTNNQVKQPGQNLELPPGRTWCGVATAPGCVQRDKTTHVVTTGRVLMLCLRCGLIVAANTIDKIKIRTVCDLRQLSRCTSDTAQNGDVFTRATLF